MKSVKLSDGTELSDDQTYKVQFAQNDYVLEEGAEDDAVQQKMSPVEVYEKYLEKHDTLEIPEVLDRG